MGKEKSKKAIAKELIAETRAALDVAEKQVDAGEVVSCPIVASGFKLQAAVIHLNHETGKPAADAAQAEFQKELERKDAEKKAAGKKKTGKKKAADKKPADDK